MAIKILLLIFFLKIAEFRLIITYFGAPKIAPDHTIFLKNFGGHAPGPPSNSMTTQC